VCYFFKPPDPQGSFENKVNEGNQKPRSLRHEGAEYRFI
jgi:hypothetical protein